jgi:hypothetical protein
MTRRLAPLGVLLAALAAAAPADAAVLVEDRISAPAAQKRVCHDRLASGAGVVQRRVDLAAASLVRARLNFSRGDWDLGIFDAGTGRSIGGSAAFGTAEMAETFADAPVIVQACRRSGASGTPLLTVGAVELPTPAAGKREVSRLVRVSAPTDFDKARLQALDLDLTEHGHDGKLDVVLHSDADEARLRSAGFNYVVVIEDLLEQDLADKRADLAYALRVPRSGMPSGRTGYRRLADFEAELKALAEAKPDLVKPLVLPNRTLEGRQVQGVEITEGVQNTEDGKPVFVQFGVHHAREWPSAEMPMEFAHDLVNGFGKDERTTRLLRAARTIIVPVINPDGYNLSREASVDLRVTGTTDEPLQPVFEGTIVDTSLNNSPGHIVAILADTYIGQFAYKRRNCRVKDGQAPAQGECSKPGPSPVGNRDKGVDPNRNYGGLWGGPGASHSPTVDTYRGPAPFSEPETQNVKALVSSRQVTTLITNHTYSDLVLRPPGLKAQGPPPDEPVYKALGDDMAAQNGYVSQKSYELYDTTGTTEDWSYYATGGLGFTFEIGNKEFHPPYEDVVEEYTGKGAFRGRGNREAYFRALESTADTARHSVIAGRAKPGTELTLTKAFTTFTSPVLANSSNPATAGDPIGFADRLTSTFRVPRSGVVDWHVNPSTRPIVRGSFVANLADAPAREQTGKQPQPTVPGGGARNPATTVDVPFTARAEDARTGVLVRMDWASADNDFDMLVLRKQEGGGFAEVGKSFTAGGDSNFEEVLLPNLIPGDYVMRVVNFTSTDPNWTWRVAFFGPGPNQPAPKTVETWELRCGDGPSTKIAVERGERFDAGRLCGPDDAAVERQPVVLRGGATRSQGQGARPLAFSVVVDRRRLGTALRRGQAARGSCTATCRISAALVVDRRTQKRLGLRSATVARASGRRLFNGSRRMNLRFSREAQRKLRRARSVRFAVRAVAVDDQRRRATASRSLTVRR